jgi:hypothetical protein
MSEDNGGDLLGTVLAVLCIGAVMLVRGCARMASMG